LSHLAPDQTRAPLGELDGASEKAIRDAGAIPVTEI
jgi:hypothetical protein